MADELTGAAGPQPGVSGAYVVDGITRCGGLYADGRRCLRYKGLNPTNGRCMRHGGRVERGIASPLFKHGQRSRVLKHLPDNLKRTYRELYDDDELLTLVDELQLSKARYLDLLDLLKDPENGEIPARTWRQLDTLWEQMKSWQRAGDLERTRELLNRIQDAIKKGVQRGDVEHRIDRVIDQRRRLVSVESRRRNQEKELVARAQFGAFVKAVLLAIAHESEISIDAKGRIQDSILRILNISNALKAAV
jgi:hypothetical protein